MPSTPDSQPDRPDAAPDPDLDLDALDVDAINLDEDDPDNPADIAPPDEGPANSDDTATSVEPPAALGDDNQETFPVAFISDIHGNLDALNTVLEDIDKRGVKRIVCLGDVIGYGPNPRECLDLVMERCEWSLMGNHDFAVLYEPTSFNASAEASSFWTRAQLEQDSDPVARRRRFEFLGGLSIRKVFDGALCVHASPRKPINEYIFPDDAHAAPTKMAQIFDRFETRCFCGHTHVTGVFTSEPDFYPPADIKGVYKFSADEKCIINPGSVGQPRDRDPRASYAIVHTSHVEFVRLTYPVQAVINKIKPIPELNDFLGHRLIEGR